MNKGKLTKNIKQVFVALLCLAVVFLFILPFLWIFATSMRPSRESFALPPSFWPARLDFTNYRAVLNTIPFFHYAFNSMTIAVLSTLGMTLFTSMAAFGLSRLQLRFSGAIYSVFLAGMMVPASAMLVPVFTIICGIGLLDSKWALILLGMYYPVGLLMMRQTMMTIPKSYDEAAYIDGAGSFRYLLADHSSHVPLVGHGIRSHVLYCKLEQFPAASDTSQLDRELHPAPGNAVLKDLPGQYEYGPGVSRRYADADPAPSHLYFCSEISDPGRTHIRPQSLRKTGIHREKGR